MLITLNQEQWDLKSVCLSLLVAKNLLLSLKSIISKLVLVDTYVSDDAIVIHVLNGVGPKFKELVTAINVWEAPISFEKLHDKLMEYETFLKWEETCTNTQVVTTLTTRQTNTLYKGNGG